VELPHEYSNINQIVIRLDKPQLISPTGTVETSRPTYKWYRVPGASWYYLWVRDASGDTIKIWYRSEDLVFSADRTTCEVTPTKRLLSGSVEWWIQAWNKSSGYSDWSSGMVFTAAPLLPGKAVLFSPSGSTSDVLPTYYWSGEAPPATQYYLWVNDKTGTPVIQTWYASGEYAVDLKGNCSVTPAQSIAAGPCKWWIQTWNDEGYGPWSDPLGFLLMYPAPAIVVLTSPTGGVATTKPTYTWVADSFATSYYLWVEDSTGVVIKTWYTAAQVDPLGTGTCTITPDVALVKGLCKWWVQAYNAEGYGPWSLPLEFEVSV
jgi:hypothetical protein